MGMLRGRFRDQRCLARSLASLLIGLARPEGAKKCLLLLVFVFGRGEYLEITCRHVRLRRDCDSIVSPFGRDRVSSTFSSESKISFDRDSD